MAKQQRKLVSRQKDDPILAQIEAHYEEIKGERKCLMVEEWGVTIYWDPITPREFNRIHQLANSEKPGEMYSEALIMKARTESGEPMFPHRMNARDTLLDKTDYRVVERVAAAMLGVNSPTRDDLKN